VLRNAVAWFTERGINVQRVLTDNGGCYRSLLWRDTCTELGVTPKRALPGDHREPHAEEGTADAARPPGSPAQPGSSSRRTALASRSLCNGGGLVGSDG